jgi:hypothetical protein
MLCLEKRWLRKDLLVWARILLLKHFVWAVENEARAAENPRDSISCAGQGPRKYSQAIGLWLSSKAVPGEKTCSRIRISVSFLSDSAIRIKGFQNFSIKTRHNQFWENSFQEHHLD